MSQPRKYSWADSNNMTTVLNIQPTAEYKIDMESILAKNR